MKRITASILSVLLMLSLVFSSSVFAADKDSFKGLFTKDTAVTEVKADVGVEYRGHIENKGDYPLDGSWIEGPETLGTQGQWLRLEAFWLQLNNDVPDDLHIEYRVHVQNDGWQDWVQDGEIAGTQGRALQLESLEIKLVDDEGELSEDYSVRYTGHVQNQGDVPANDPNARLGQTYYADGEQLGTDGMFLRLEAIRVEIVEKEADLTAYTELYDSIMALDEEDYTTASWDNLMQVMEDNAMTTADRQADVDAAVAAIQVAFDALVEVDALDFTEFDALVAEVQGLDRGLYTEASLADLDAAVEANPVESLTTQAEIDAAVVEIQAAFDALVMVLNVESVSAINTKTLKVNFNTAVSEADQALATFTVKRGTNTVSMLAPVWAADGTSVQLPRSANLLAGTYTVTVGGIDLEVDSGTVVVEAQKAVSMEITTTRVMNKTAQNVGYVVLDQYGEEMTVLPGNITVQTFNTTDASRAVTGAAINSLNFAATAVDDVVKVTAFLTANPAISAVKDITVSSIVLDNVMLGDPVLPTGATRLETGLAGVVIPVSSFDNYGEEMQLTAATWTSGTATADGLFPVFSGLTSVAVNADGDLLLTLGPAGTATLTITNPATGVITTKTITVVAKPDTATIVMTQPENPIRMGTNSNIPFELIDQFGEEFPLTSPQWNVTDVGLSSSNAAVATVSWVGNNIQVVPVSAGTTTIFANVVTSVSTGTATLTITVEAAPAAEMISVLGTPKTNLAQGETVSATADPGALSFKVVDQDGNPIDLAATTAAGVKANLTVTSTPANVLTAPTAKVLMASDMSTTTGTTKGIPVTAGTVNGTATVQVQLFNDLNSNDTMDAGEEMASVVDVVYNVSSSVLTQGEVTAITNGTLNADGTAAYAAPAAAQTITYTLQDQAGQVYTTTAATDVVWTITNTGTTAVTVNDGTAKTLAAGATTSYTTTTGIGDTTDTIIVNSADAKKVEVSVAAAGVTTPAELDLYFYDVILGVTTATYTGTVVAFDEATTWAIISTSVGNVVVDDYTLGTPTFKVDGNTASQTQFETALTIGDTLRVTSDGTNIANELTNN